MKQKFQMTIHFLLELLEACLVSLGPAVASPLGGGH